VFQCVIIAQLNIENEGFDPVTLPVPKNKKPKNAAPPVKDKREKLTKKKRKFDKFWFLITITATILLLGGLFLQDTVKDFYKNNIAKKFWLKDKEDTKIENTALISSIAVDDTLPDISNEATVNEEINEPVLEEKKPQAPKTERTITLTNNQELYIPFEVGKYYVIAGSFAQEAKALQHIKEKKLGKYNAKLVVQPQNARIRVCIGIFDNEQNAVDFAAQIDKNYWVLK
jgi:hypothetical protein